MKNLFKVATAIALTAPFVGSFAAETDLATKLEQLERIVMEQNSRLNQQEAEIQALRGQGTETRALVMDLDAELDSTLDARIADGLAALKDGSSITLGKGIDGLTLKNDARFRYQIIDDGGANDDERLRLRLRTGATYVNKAEDWEFGVGMEVGSSSADSANANLNNTGTFSSLDVFLDYAYAKHKWDAFTVSVGQMKNPLKTTNLMWDGDVRPVGAAASFADAGFFATLAWFDAHRGLGNRNADANALAGQIGFESQGEDAEFGLALGYLVGNEQFDRSVAGGNNADYDAQIVDLYGWFGSSAGEVDFGFFGHGAMNLGADGASMVAGQQADDNDLAWAFGANAKIGALKLSYAYKYIEADSVIGALNDSDFGATATTNVEGHSLGASYSFTKNVSFAATALFAEDIEGAGEADTYQFDLTYKF